tara:strand:- start:1521 stop:1718 length:198 start_codon:yes stop_codon:yes gene_type:complete
LDDVDDVDDGGGAGCAFERAAASGVAGCVLLQVVKAVCGLARSSMAFGMTTAGRTEHQRAREALE